MAEQVKNIWQSWWQTQEDINQFWQGWLEKQGGKDMWQKLWPDPEKAFEYWKQAMFPFQGDSMPDMPGIKDLFFNDNVKELYQTWLKMTTESYKNYAELMPTWVDQEALEKFWSGMDLYLQPFMLYSGLMDKLPLKQSTQQWKDLFQAWSQNYLKFLENAFPVNLPDPVRSLLKNPIEIAGLSQLILSNFFTPWLDFSPELKDNYFRLCKGDQKALVDYLRVWHQAYSESYGKFFQLPAFGSGKESFEKLSASLDSYMQYLAAVSEMWGTLHKISTEAAESLMEKLAKQPGEEAPKTYKELYRLWWQTNEDAFFELFKTDSFARILGKTVDAGVAFKKHLDELLLEYISQLPVPTNRDMDSVYKTIHELKATIKKQEKKIEALSAIVKQVDS